MVYTVGIPTSNLCILIILSLYWCLYSLFSWSLFHAKFSIFSIQILIHQGNLWIDSSGSMLEFIRAFNPKSIDTRK